MASEPQLPSADDILRVLMEAGANGGYGKFFRAVDQETFVGGKRVTKQQVPELPESAAITIHQVKVTLYGSKPPIWRRLELPSMMTPGWLHQVLQAAFTWDGYHLHVFETVCGEFGDPLQDDGWAERQDEETVTIAQVAAAKKAKIVYVYDFGDDWRHDIAVEKILPAAAGIAYPRCTAGPPGGTARRLRRDLGIRPRSPRVRAVRSRRPHRRTVQPGRSHYHRLTTRRPVPRPPSSWRPTVPRRVVLPEIIPVRQPSEAELAAAARAASAMQAARRLADWFGDVPVDRAAEWEAPAARSRAAAALGLVAPGGLVTPEADQALRWAYEVAYHARYLDTDDDRQLIQRSAELSGHQERDDDDILHDWFHALDALYAHGVEEALPAGAEPGPLDFHGIGGHPLFTLLEHHGTATVEAVSAAIADGATENLAPSRSRSEWKRWTARYGDPVERYLRLAAGLAAVTVSRSQVTLTPLATWALLKELNALTEQLPPSAELTARQVIECRLAMTGEDFAAELDGWLAVRDPADAVEALLAAAPGPEDVAYRRTAVQIASGIDGDTEHAWRSALSIPAIRPYVIVELNRRAGRDIQRDPLPGLEPLDCDAVVLASETIMGAYALSIRNSQAIAGAVSAAVHPGQEPAALFDAMWRSRHSVALQALKVAGELHPDKKTAKAARAAAWKASSARV